MKKHIPAILSCALLAAFLSACGGTASAPSSAVSDNDAAPAVEETEPVSDDTAEVSEEEQTEAETEAETEPETEPAEEKLYGPSEVAKIGDWSVFVYDREVSDSIKTSEYFGFKPDDGSKYLRVFVNITNNGKTANTFLPSYSIDGMTTKLYYGDGYEFSASNLLGYDQDLHDKSLNPLSSFSGEVIFTVPDIVAESTDDLIFSLSLGDETVKIKIR